MSSLDPTLRVTTPERVSVELPLAGIGFRALASGIDAAAIFAVVTVSYFLFTLAVPDPLDAWLGLSGVVRAALAGGAVLTLWVYWTVMEIAWNGQTLGKRALGIRVVRSDGRPLTAGDSALRNLMRLVDFLPVCYPVGLITMLVDSRQRRLGDLVAGTVLVREQRFDLSKYQSAQASIPAADVELITSFLARAASLEPEARLRVGRALAARFGAIGAELDDAAIRAHLEAVLRG
ncbi:MAG: RDD family protein [Archangium sp.]|nr:RDD family protein [Archangium sp.]